MAKRASRRSAAQRPAKGASVAGVTRTARAGSRAKQIADPALAALVDDLREIEDGPGNGMITLPDERTLKVTSLAKPTFGDPALTKGALMRYYAQVSPALLPAIADRPLVLKRWPDGIDGESFFQQRPPSGAPTVMRTADVPTDEGTQPRVIGGDLGTTLALVQFGVISMDPWHSRCESLEVPDYSFLDLDPGPAAPFERVVEVALAVRDELTALGLHGVPRTSGSRGMHIAIPLPPGLTYDVALLLAQLIAARVADAHPRIATVERAVRRRNAGAIYVDYLQNVRGKSIASVYSVRARRGATVATPLEWEEVAPGLDPEAFTMSTVPARLAEMGDVWARGMRTSNTRRAIARAARGS